MPQILTDAQHLTLAHANENGGTVAHTDLKHLTDVPSGVIAELVSRGLLKYEDNAYRMTDKGHAALTEAENDTPRPINYRLSPTQHDALGRIAAEPGGLRADSFGWDAIDTTRRTFWSLADRGLLTENEHRRWVPSEDGKEALRRANDKLRAIISAEMDAADDGLGLTEPELRFLAQRNSMDRERGRITLDTWHRTNYALRVRLVEKLLVVAEPNQEGYLTDAARSAVAAVEERLAAAVPGRAAPQAMIPDTPAAPEDWPLSAAAWELLTMLHRTEITPDTVFYQTPAAARQELLERRLVQPLPEQSNLWRVSAQGYAASGLPCPGSVARLAVEDYDRWGGEMNDEERDQFFAETCPPGAHLPTWRSVVAGATNLVAKKRALLEQYRRDQQQADEMLSAQLYLADHLADREL